MSLPIRKFQGGKEYKKFLDGTKLTRKEAMLANCYECMVDTKRASVIVWANPVRCISSIHIKIVPGPPKGLRSVQNRVFIIKMMRRTTKED